MRGGKGIVVGAQTQEQKEWDEPYANTKERGDVHKRKDTPVLFTPFSAPECPHRLTMCMSPFGEVEEPNKVVSENKDARRDERRRFEGDEGPCWRKVREIDDVAYDGESNAREG
jgi:hypothetical protein